MHLFTTDMIWNKFRGCPATAAGNCCPWQGFKINICQCQLNTFSAASKIGHKIRKLLGSIIVLVLVIVGSSAAATHNVELFRKRIKTKEWQKRKKKTAPISSVLRDWQSFVSLPSLKTFWQNNFASRRQQEEAERTQRGTVTGLG